MRTTGDTVVRIVVAVLAITVPVLEVVTAGERNQNCEAVQDLRGDILEFVADQQNVRNRERFLDRANAIFRQPEC